MTATHGQPTFPSGFHRFTPAFVLWALALLGGAGFGVYCFVQQTVHGLVMTGMRTAGSGGAGWGLYIAFDVFFIGVSFAGITVAALIRLFGLKDLHALARMAELLTIVALLLGAMVVMADLGSPLNGLLNLPKFARPISPFFGTFTMVIGGYLFASLVYFFLAGRADAALCAKHAPRLNFLYRLWATGFKGTQAEYVRHHKSSFWLSLFVLPLLVTAHSTLGFIFGIQGGRPGWFSALQAPSFVVMAGVSGIGVLIVIAAVVRKLVHLESLIGISAFRWLGNFLWVLIIVTLYFIIADELTASYASGGKEREFSHVLTMGETYSTMFRLEVASLVSALVVLFSQFILKKPSIGWTVVAGLLVNVAAVLKRYLLVVPSQTHGLMLPYPEGHYAPTWIELGLIGGLLCLGMLLYSLFIKVFPIVPMDHPHVDEGDSSDKGPGERPRLRLWATFASMGLGVAVAFFGFVISLRYGTESYQDPLVPFAPVMFIGGVILTFISAAVYEVFPSGRSPAKTTGLSGPAREKLA